MTVRTERDCFGREVHKSVRSGGIEQGAYRYQWGIANRLLSKENELTGTVTRYDYDRFDFLIRQETMQGSETDVIYRTPDFVGNLFETSDKKDRKYGAGGKLLEDKEHFYHYDDEGNLVFKEFKELRGNDIVYERKRMRRERGIDFLATGTGWNYKWNSNGTLKKVIRPDGRPVEFQYDALGRRISKQYFGKKTRWIWNGNVPLHEWSYKVTDGQLDKEKNIQNQEPTEDIITWVFETGTFVPTAKILNNKQYSIVSDYLGTPIQMYDGQGNTIWDCLLDIYGKVTTFDGGSEFDCPFRFQGQYADKETELYYNRFRYYDYSIGNYIIQDPIGLVGGFCLYSYTEDTNEEIDVFGLSKSMFGKARARVIQRARKLQKTANPPRITSASVSRKTGKVYYGDSGVKPSRISAEMKGRMDFNSIQEWDIDNCAEFNSVNKATLKGEKISNLDVYTIEVETLTPRIRCDNCQITTDGAHVKSDIDGKH